MPRFSGWSYSRRRDGGRVEQAVWSGNTTPSLAPHFHLELQISVVLAGIRRFKFLTDPVVARAGETVLIGPNVPHQPMGLDAPDTCSVNYYVMARVHAATPECWKVVTTPPWLASASALNSEHLAGWATAALHDDRMITIADDPTSLAAALINGDFSIEALAREAGMTREAYSRRFRRLVGLPPQQYRIAQRLNNARSLLASRHALAEVAAATGFADQSHLGRAFLSSFGTTPGAYRRAMW
jgi:AraC-like DNA-binding protein